jgi:hypothetical protein
MQVPPASANASRRGSDVGAIAEQVASLGYRVALAQAADPNLKAVILAQPLLDGDGTARRLHPRREFCKQTVAHHLENASLELGDERINHVASGCSQSRQRFWLHQPQPCNNE